MPDMPHDPQHAAPEPHAAGRPYAAWAVLSVMGGSSVIFNVVHAFRHAPHNWLLPGLYGIGPVAAAVLLSHIGADRRVGKWTRAAVVWVMLLSMATSIGATADIVEPMSGPYLNWLYGAIMDAAALVALRVILDTRSRAAADVTALELARDEAQTARLDLSGTESTLATALAELGAVRAELEAVRTASPPRSSQRSGTARRTAPKGGTRTAPKPAGPDDLTLHAEALAILAAEPAITGADLGRRLGATEGYGRKLRRALTQPDRPHDSARTTAE